MLLLNFSALISSFSKLRYFIFYVFIFYNAINDYVFFQAGFLPGTGAIFKTFNEFLLLSLLLCFFITKFGYKLAITKDFLIVGSISILTLSLGTVKYGFSSAFSDWRDIFLYLFIVILFRDLNLFHKISRNKIENIFLTLSFLSSVLAIYNYLTFNGDYTSEWRYELLLQAKLNQSEDFLEHFVSYQLMRDGNLRASGFFVSALEFAFFSATCLILAMIKYKSLNSIKSKIGYISLITVLFIGIYCSQVRTAYIIIILYFLINLMMRLMRNRFFLYRVIAISLPFVVVSFLILFHALLDTSAASRYYQYREVFTSINFIIPAGLGAFKQQYDSYFLYLIANMGLFGFVVIFYIYKRAISKSKYEIQQFTSHTILFITVFFVMSMQHVAGTFYYILILTFLYWPIRNKNEVPNLSRSF